MKFQPTYSSNTESIPKNLVVHDIKFIFIILDGTEKSQTLSCSFPSGPFSTWMLKMYELLNNEGLIASIKMFGPCCNSAALTLLNIFIIKMRGKSMKQLTVFDFFQDIVCLY